LRHLEETTFDGKHTTGLQVHPGALDDFDLPNAITSGSGGEGSTIITELLLRLAVRRYVPGRRLGFGRPDPYQCSTAQPGSIGSSSYLAKVWAEGEPTRGGSHGEMEFNSYRSGYHGWRCDEHEEKNPVETKITWTIKISQISLGLKIRGFPLECCKFKPTRRPASRRERPCHTLPTFHIVTRRDGHCADSDDQTRNP